MKLSSWISLNIKFCKMNNFILLFFFQNTYLLLFLIAQIFNDSDDLRNNPYIFLYSGILHMLQSIDVPS